MCIDLEEAEVEEEEEEEQLEFSLLRFLSSKSEVEEDEDKSSALSRRFDRPLMLLQRLVFKLLPTSSAHMSALLALRK